jgi:hypothetical protein
MQIKMTSKNASGTITAKLLSTLGDTAGLVLLDLGSPGFLLSLELQTTDVLACLPRAFAGSHQGTVSLPLGSFGHHDTLSSLDNARVEIGIAVAE